MTDSGTSVLIGRFYMATGLLALVASLYCVFTWPWPSGAVFLLGTLGGVVVLRVGLRRIRTTVAKADR